MPRYWLKAVGMGKPGGPLQTGEPLQNNWQDYDNGQLLSRVMFRRRPSVELGDRIVYYAAGRERGLIFAEGEATSHPYEEEPSDERPDYPHWVNVQLTPDLTRRFIAEGVRLNALNVDGRDIPARMMRRSHIRLTPKEYEAAVRALRRS